MTNLMRHHLARKTLEPTTMLRTGLYCAGLCFVVGQYASTGMAAELILQQGEMRPALVGDHFPDRVHEFVWRNWNTVELEKLAKILGTSVDDVIVIAKSMGLPDAVTVPEEMRERGYNTIIRRNWHLVPYEQLLELLEITPERLAFILREEDFLWLKLGGLKPQCEPLRYAVPSEAARQRAAEIRRIVEQGFGDEIHQPGEPRFDFVRQLSAPLESQAASKPADDQLVSLRMTYSYLALFGDPLLNQKLDPYPEAFLQRLSAVGVNGVWLHVVLRDMAPGGAEFPEFGSDHEQRLANLRGLVERAKKHNIGVYLYLNEPRAMPAEFFKTRPEMAGVQEKEFTALCTSHRAVRQWMADALTHIFREVPDLAGVYAITASENLTNCASHGDWDSCPHCKTRGNKDILAEVVAAIEEGVHRGNPKANVVIADWGWEPWSRSSEPISSATGDQNGVVDVGDAPDIITRLPKSVWLMSVSEWDLPIERGGIKTLVGEYSMSSIGPGPRALRHWAVAKQRGLKTAAEIQFNNTCEIASLPYLPVMDLVAEHCRNLAAHKLDGMLIGWTMGGHPSPNFELAKRMNQTPPPDIETVLDTLAQEQFGCEGAPHARKAWTLMSNAFREYPFHIKVVYNCPVQHGPANPMYPSRTDYKASVWGIPYDDLDGWRGPYPREVFAAQFEKMAEGFQPGIAELKRAVEKAPPEKRPEVETELRYAKAAAINFQSVANQAYFIIARDALANAENTLSPEERQRLRAEIKRRLESEIVLARELYTLTREDSRIGFEPSCQYFYLPLDLVEKVINCRWLLSQLDEGKLGDPNAARKAK